MAEAERKCAAANAQIGVNVAAYFPVLNLTGSTGFDSGDLGPALQLAKPHLVPTALTSSSRFSRAGRSSAQVKEAKAAYEENVANYRESVLVAFQNVEDSLSSLRYLAEQQEAQGPRL